jgi:4-amino-4-deoxy-L-arabinose transferase-like glycosyltransferase
MARRLGGGRFAQALAAVAFLIAPIYLRFGTFLNIPSLEVFFWSALAYTLILLVQKKDQRLWLLIGLIIGAGLLNKHTMLFGAFSLVLGLLLTPHRKHLLGKWIWLGAGLALLLFLPNAIWQVQHGFPTLEFVQNLNKDVMSKVSIAEFVLGQVLYLHPLSAPIWLLGLVHVFSKDGKDYRILGWMFVVVFVLLLAAKSKIYYLAPLFPLLLAPGAVRIEQLIQRYRANWLKPTVFVALTGGALVFVPIALPVFPIETLDAYVERFAPRFIQDPAELTEHFHKEFGWENQVATVAAVYHSLPSDEQVQAAILAGNYGEAAAVDFFGPAYGLPRSISGHHSYYLWGPGDASGEVVIAFGVPLETLLAIFDRVDQAATITHPYAPDFENDLPVYVCRKPRQPLKQIWPRLKRFVRIN